MGKARTLLFTAAAALYAAIQLRDALGGGVGRLAPAALLRLRPLTPPPPSGFPATAAIAGFGLMRGGCAVSTVTGGVGAIVSGDPLADGYHFALAGAATANGGGLAAWTVEGSSDGGSSWAPAG